MKERGILFKGHLVKKIQAGLKGQTRRVAKAIQAFFDFAVGEYPEHPLDCVRCENGEAIFEFQSDVDDTNEYRFQCPYGTPGDRLYVRECFCAHWCAYPDKADQLLAPNFRKITSGKVKDKEITEDDPLFAYYKADFERGGKPLSHSRWTPSIHMPRWASRIDLEITEIRIERIQDISEEDVQAEGIAPIYQPAFVAAGEIQGPDEIPALDIFPETWDAINKKRGFGWDVNPWVWVIDFKDIT